MMRRLTSFLRFDAGDPEVHKAMTQFAEFAEEAEVAIEKGDFSRLADLMEKVRSKKNCQRKPISSRNSMRDFISEF